MKKIISLILAILCICAVFCSCSKNKAEETSTTTASAAENNNENAVYTSGDYNYVKLDDGTAKIVKYNKSGESDLDIPNSLDGLKVTVIGENAFTEEQNITKVRLPRYLTKIESYAFNKSTVGYVWFHQINDDTSTIIEPYAFSECVNLKQVILSKSVKRIEAQAFHLCSVPRYIKFYVDPEFIGADAFNFGRSTDKLEFWHVGDISNYNNLSSYAEPRNIPLVLDKNTAE